MPDDPVFASGRTNRSIPSPTVIPVLRYPDVPAAAAWLCRAFGFEERLRIGSHRIQLTVGEGAVIVAESPQAALEPDQFGHVILVRVQDADRHIEVARKAGAQILSEPVSEPYGERQYKARDLAGHVWNFSQTLGDVDPAAWGGELVSPGPA